MAAVGTAAALDEPRLAQALEDVLEEAHRDLLRARERLGLHRALRLLSLLGGRQLDARTDGVVDLGGDAHAPIMPMAPRSCIVHKSNRQLSI